jgi:hypothetical protein
MTRVEAPVRLDRLTRCPRCEHAMQPIAPWPHWRKVRLGYFAVLGLTLCGGPVILADGFVLIPTLMLYMSAVGPLNKLAKTVPVCSRCSCPLD